MPTHRVALISDIHGNALALEAVLKDIQRRGADRIVCLGDVATLGPQPRRTIALVRDHCAELITGNHEAYLLDPTIDDAHLAAAPVRSAIDWCREQVTEDDLGFLARFAATHAIDLGPHHRLLAYHGSPRSNTEDILATSDPDRVEQALGASDATVFAGGHTHVQMLRQHRGRWVINAGSVGMPFEEYVHLKKPKVLPFAEYAILRVEGRHLQADLHRVALDIPALIAAARAWDHELGQDLAQMYATAVVR